MKHFLTVCVLSVASAWISVESQETLNSNADNIIGMYYVAHEGEESKVRFTKVSDGTYTAQTVWKDRATIRTAHIFPIWIFTIWKAQIH